jgi:hypothetical protein
MFRSSSFDTPPSAVAETSLFASSDAQQRSQTNQPEILECAEEVGGINNSHTRIQASHAAESLLNAFRNRDLATFAVFTGFK